jgi:hypothetical protein
MKSPPIFTGRCISIHPITQQFRKFHAEFDERELRDFMVAATILDTSRATGRPPGGRSERVRGSRAGLFELRITPQGRRGPHTRALYVCEKRDVLMVRGLRKAERGIPQREIELADRGALALGQKDNERHGAKARGSP